MELNGIFEGWGASGGRGRFRTRHYPVFDTIRFGFGSIRPDTGGITVLQCEKLLGGASKMQCNQDRHTDYGHTMRYHCKQKLHTHKANCFGPHKKSDNLIKKIIINKNN